MLKAQVLSIFSITALALLALLLTTPVLAATPEEQAIKEQTSEEQVNAELARQFYQQVWFSDHPEVVDQLFAPEYVIHDVGGIDGFVEPAEMQKDIAGFLWDNGRMGGTIDYQLAQGDLVATRWYFDYQPTSWWMKLMNTGSRNPVPIINVFRFKEGKIVEVWNHRHDIDLGYQTNRILMKGFFAGILFCILIGFIFRFARSRRRKSKA